MGTDHVVANDLNVSSGVPVWMATTPDQLPPLVGTVAIETHGCKLNQADSAQLAREFANRGYTTVDSVADADIVVVNTCTVTATADSKARQALRAARRHNPDAVVVAAGCYPERAAEALRAMPEVSLVVGNRDKSELVSLAVSAAAKRGYTVERFWPDGITAGGTGILARNRAMIKIQEGCDQVCAYCIVPKVRGRERSISPDTLVEAVRRNVAAGMKEVVLTGTQLGTYGFDLDGVNLPGLLDRILDETDVARLRVSSLQAHEISLELLSRWDDARLCPHFHVPLQSGSDRVLKAMRRRYDTERFRRAVELVRETAPDAGITTDVIVGFPGEDADEHVKSLEFAEAMQFADMHVFPYSQRPGTSAHHFAAQVGAEEKRRRAGEMAAVAVRTHGAYRRGLLGEVRNVLWETARAQDDGQPVWRGLTDNYVRVNVATGQDLTNRIMPARLIAVSGKAMIAELEG